MFPPNWTILCSVCVVNVKLLKSGDISACVSNYWWPYCNNKNMQTFCRVLHTKLSDLKCWQGKKHIKIIFLFCLLIYIGSEHPLLLYTTRLFTVMVPCVYAFIIFFILFRPVPWNIEILLFLFFDCHENVSLCNDQC